MSTYRKQEEKAWLPVTEGRQNGTEGRRSSSPRTASFQPRPHAASRQGSPQVWRRLALQGAGRGHAAPAQKEESKRRRGRARLPLSGHSSSRIDSRDRESSASILHCRKGKQDPSHTAGSQQCRLQVRHSQAFMAERRTAGSRHFLQNPMVDHPKCLLQNSRPPSER